MTGLAVKGARRPDQTIDTDGPLAGNRSSLVYASVFLIGVAIAMAIGWFFFDQESDAFRFGGTSVTDQNNFMERLRQVIVDYETVAERLETGKEAVFRISRSGEKQDSSARTAGTIDALFPTTKKSLHVMRRGGNSVALVG